jgi:hypothetical protein
MSFNAETKLEDGFAEATAALGAAVEPRARSFIGRRATVTLGRWRRAVLRTPSLVISWLVVLTVLVAAVFPSLFTSDNPLIGVYKPLAAPSARHIFGTDQLGRDMFTRVVYGTSQSLESVVLAVLIGFVVGTTIGLLAGFIGRWVDDVLMRLIDVILSVPSLLVTIARSIMRMLSPSARVTGGCIEFEGRDILKIKESSFRSTRGRLIGLIPQDPMVSLNPLHRIGRQVVEPVVATGRGWPSHSATRWRCSCWTASGSPRRSCGCSSSRTSSLVACASAC